jgi:hypothetical protein
MAGEKMLGEGNFSPPAPRYTLNGVKCAVPSSAVMRASHEEDDLTPATSASRKWNNSTSTVFTARAERSARDGPM